jgi:hypothetical protein
MGPIAGFGVLTEGHNRDVLNNYSTASTLVQSSATADAFGSWVEFVANVGDRPIQIIRINVSTEATTALDGGDVQELEIGTGAASSEVREFGVGFKQSSAVGGSITHTNTTNLPNRRIAASARLSGRVRDTKATANAYYVMIEYIKL